MNRSRVETLIAGFSGRTILVLGDVMLDETIWGTVRRISPEAPVPVVEVTDQTYALGGAGNVVANIRMLGGNPIPIGIVGRDNPADRVLGLMQQRGVEISGLVRDDRQTTLKTRIVAHHQQIVRTDRETRNALSASANAALAEAFVQHLHSADAVIVSDYNKGVVNRDLLTRMLPKAHQANIPVFLDPKVHHADYYRPITVITPNQREAESLSGMAIDTEEQLEEAGRHLLRKFECEYVLITRGEEGMSLFDRSGSHHLPTFAREVFDVTGAGDTVIATLALASASGATMEESAVLANHAAGLVVGKVGAATVTGGELLTDFDSRHAHSAG